MADAMGITNTYYSNILAGKGRSNLRKEHLKELQNVHNVNPAWVLTGDGEPFLKERERDLLDGVSEAQVQSLYDYTLQRMGIEKLLPRQEFEFRKACARSYTDNPQLKTLDQLFAASRIYLNFILQFPHIEI